MNRTFLITSLLIIGIIGAYLGYRLFTWETGVPNPYTYETLSGTRETYEEMKKSKAEQAKIDIDTYNTAITQRDMNLCDQLSEVHHQAQCKDMIRMATAITSGDRDACETLTDTILQQECHDTVIYTLSASGATKDLCDEISDEHTRSQCKTDIDTRNYQARSASGTLDEAFCMSLSDELQRTCRARISRTNDQDTYRQALASKDISLCNTITVEALKNQCRDTLILEIAIREKNADYCENILDSEKSSFCKKSLSNQNEALLYQTIISQWDITKCSILTIDSYKHQCHDVLTIALVRTSADTTHCQSLYNTGMIASCEKIVIKK